MHGFIYIFLEFVKQYELKSFYMYFNFNILLHVKLKLVALIVAVKS